ncbi:hypothetical protein T472_0202840 [Youngiibacter fragilis 232.1]|uniref:Uncharacterized protein n=1 Tax=Youngiibacter fragilis 232.1 TaxID=994573 RepID=V7I9W2_9CLOT|nr:hypothetical protein T472_0202840 [Youngiibacter fragilis 232.1]
MFVIHLAASYSLKSAWSEMAKKNLPKARSYTIGINASQYDKPCRYLSTWLKDFFQQIIAYIKVTVNRCYANYEIIRYIPFHIHRCTKLKLIN